MSDDIETFADRMDFVLAKRTPTTWCKEIGLTPNIISRIRSGHVPGQDVLTRIMRCENASLSWLLDGEGAPFYVSAYIDEIDFIESAQDHLGDNEYSRLYILDSERAPVFIFATDVYMKPSKKKEYSYIDLSILSAPWTTKIQSLAIQLRDEERTIVRRLNEKDTSRIRAGRVGTFLIFGDENHKGILDQPDIGPAILDKHHSQSDTYEIRVDWMRKAISSVDSVASSMPIKLSNEQKATAIAAVYRYVAKTDDESQFTDTTFIESIIEATT